MEDISLHILDIAQNSIDAGAGRIEISIEEDRKADVLVLRIRDDGRGMDRESLKALKDPFFSTKGKKTGLGIPLLAQSAREAGGDVTVESEPGGGTTLEATLRLGHIDRKPLGDLTSTLLVLIGGNPDIDVLFRYRIDDREYRLDTAEIKEQLGEVPINYPDVLSLLRRDIGEGIKELRKGGQDEQGESPCNR